MSATEVITYLGIAKRTFYKHINSGKFPQPTSGSTENRNSRWDPDVVEKWLDDSRKSDAAEAAYAIEHPSGQILLGEGADLAARILYTHDLPVEVAYSFNFGRRKRLTAHEKECLIAHIRRLKADEKHPVTPRGTPSRCP